MSKELAAQRRKEILAAARRCFSVRGFHATGMAHIAKEFGMSAGHIYNYFPSKNAIIEAIVQEGMEEFYANHEAFKACQGDYDKLSEHLSSTFERLFNNERMCLSLEILSAASHDPNLQAMLHENDRKVRGYLREAAGYVEGDCDRLIDARVDLMMAQFEGIGLRKLRNPDFDIEMVTKLMAERLAMPRAHLKARLQELEEKA